jgi:hypothetical protein
VKLPLPFPQTPSHICLKPALTPVTTTGWLSNLNAAGRKPNEDAATVP